MESPPDRAAADRVLASLFERRPDLADAAPAVRAAFDLLSGVLSDGHTVLVCGNGGSAADSEHIAGELAKPCARPRPVSSDLVARLEREGDDGTLAAGLQEGFSVIPLVSQAALTTAIANDQGADLVFAQQVVAYGRPSDCLFVLSTSGRSRNIVLALRTARALRLSTLAITGPDGSALSGLADVLVELPGEGASEVQESHQPVYHALCLALEAQWYR